MAPPPSFAASDPSAQIFAFSSAYLNTLVILATIFHFLGFSSTAFRVWQRWSIGRFWWDDLYALLGAVFALMLFADLWLRYYFGSHEIGSDKAHLPLRLVVVWSESLCYTFLLWLARISIAVSIVRMLPPSPLRTLTAGTAWAFILACLLMAAFKAYACGHDLQWQSTWAMDCQLGHSYTVLKITTDVTASVCLVAIPLRMLWNSHLPKAERWMIRAVCMTSLLATCVSMVHASYVLAADVVLEGYTAHYEAGITLMVSNLLIITTSVYRWVRHLREPNSSSSQSSHNSSSQAYSYPEHQISRRAPPRLNPSQTTRMSLTQLDSAEEESSWGTRNGGGSLPVRGGGAHQEVERGTQSLGAGMGAGVGATRPEEARKVDFLFETIWPR